MRIAGQWVGLGLGDDTAEVGALKAFMKNKFSYAKSLVATSLFDQQTQDAVLEMQRRYNAAGKLVTGKYTPGIVNAETKYVMGFAPRPPKLDTRPVLFTVCGTGVPWWVGPDADTARAVESQYLWQPIGYSAKPFPMGPSISEAKDEMVVQMTKHRDRVLKYGCAWAGYSQGALAISELFELDVKPENGRLHWAKNSLRKAVTWGNPMRERGAVWPDAGALPSPKANGGVTGILMADTPTWWRNYAHKNDLYCDVPPDESGENRTAIWQIIRNGDVMRGPDSLLRQVLELTGVVQDSHQITEVTGMFKAMMDAMIFFGKQTGPHVNYSAAEAIAYLRS